MLPGRINSHMQSLSLMHSFECNIYCATYLYLIYNEQKYVKNITTKSKLL